MYIKLHFLYNCNTWIQLWIQKNRLYIVHCICICIWSWSWSLTRGYSCKQPQNETIKLDPGHLKKNFDQISTKLAKMQTVINSPVLVPVFIKNPFFTFFFFPFAFFLLFYLLQVHNCTANHRQGCAWETLWCNSWQTLGNWKNLLLV